LITVLHLGQKTKALDEGLGATVRVYSPQLESPHAKFERLSALIVLFLAVSVSGQNPTDFTGRWRQLTNSGTQRQLQVADTTVTLIAALSCGPGNGAPLEILRPNVRDDPFRLSIVTGNSDRKS